MLDVATFWDRTGEIDLLRRRLGRGELGYVTGRRRVGKTALLTKACEDFGGIYHQAVEGTPQQQLLHLAEELGQRFSILRDAVPRSWGEFFRLLSREKLPPLLVFDEFPYWVNGDPTLPSQLQKWVDHELPRHKTLLVVSGSSQSMLFSEFLGSEAPLYGRAAVHLHLKPLGYDWFCRALDYPIGNPESFVRYSLVGGVPHYWRLMPRGRLLNQAEHLYFEPSAILAEEPAQLLRDEGVTGVLPKAILDLVGRGVSKPSELASRLGTAQGNLSRPLALLRELGLLHKELPFGGSARTTKKVIYSLSDPALAFYYGVFLPSRTRWTLLKPPERKRLLDQHASHVWEHFVRQAFPGSGRYWEGALELDLVAPDPDGGHLIAECKWSDLSRTEERLLLRRLEEKFSRSALAKRLRKVRFGLFSQKDLPRLAKQAARILTG